MVDPDRLRRALAAIDAVNAKDPNQIEVQGGLEPGERVIVSSYASFIEVERLFIDR